MGVNSGRQKNHRHHGDINKVSHRLSILEPEWATPRLAVRHPDAPIPVPADHKVAASEGQRVVKRRGEGVKKVLSCWRAQSRWD